MEVYSSLNRDGEGRVREKHYRIITALCSVAIMFMKEPNANFGGHTIICIYTTICMHACTGWDGCRDRVDGNTMLTNQLQYEKPYGRYGKIRYCILTLEVFGYLFSVPFLTSCVTRP